MLNLSVVILTYNEALHIQRALHGLIPLDARVFVVDSFSSDTTIELARAMGATVVQHAFVNQAQQLQWALETLPLKTDWVMRLDADEILTPELVTEIQSRLPTLQLEVTGINLKRRHIFLDRWIRHGGRYPVTLLRIWRRGAARVEQRWMDEHMVLVHGQAVTFGGDFADHNLNNLTYLTNKHNLYATREAVEVLSSKYRLAHADAGVRGGRTSFQAWWKRALKEELYNRLPLWGGPLAYFLFRYVLQLGFLDGRAGLIYHTLQGFWYRFLVGAKIAEFKHLLSLEADSGDRLSALERLSGLPLRSQAEVRARAMGLRGPSGDARPPMGKREAVGAAAPGLSSLEHPPTTPSD